MWSLLSTLTLLQTFIAPTTCTYLFTVAGAQGGTRAGRITTPGGLGAVVTAAVYLQAGASVPIVVARMGYANPTQFSVQAGAGGGGLSAVYTDGDTLPTIVAGVLAKYSLPIWPGCMSCDFSCGSTIAERMYFKSKVLASPQLFITSMALISCGLAHQLWNPDLPQAAAEVALGVPLRLDRHQRLVMRLVPHHLAGWEQGVQRQVLPGKEVHCKLPASCVARVMDAFAHEIPFIEVYMQLTRSQCRFPRIVGFPAALGRIYYSLRLVRGNSRTNLQCTYSLQVMALMVQAVVGHCGRHCQCLSGWHW